MHKDGETGHNDIDASYDEHFQLTDIGTCRGDPEQREDVTEIMVDGVCNHRRSVSACVQCEPWHQKMPSSVNQA